MLLLMRRVARLVRRKRVERRVEGCESSSAYFVLLQLRARDVLTLSPFSHSPFLASCFVRDGIEEKTAALQV